jgi:acetolactate synthase regulatory subunit
MSGKAETRKSKFETRESDAEFRVSNFEFRSWHLAPETWHLELHMQWLIMLETEQDLIVTCRLLNVFRRKGLKITTLAMAARPHGFSMMAMLDSSEAQIDHLFNFLRRTEGVERVTYYRHQTSATTPLVFIDADSLPGAEVLKTFPGSRLVFASQGKYLLEVPAEGCSGGFTPSAAVGDVKSPPLGDVKSPLQLLSLACVKTTRPTPHPVMAGAQA